MPDRLTAPELGATDDWLLDHQYDLGYYSRSVVAHLIRNEGLVGGTGYPACVRYHVYYRGTGTQAEHERARAMPLCLTCARKVGLIPD